jgi:predicted transcriptional regulator
MYKGRLDTIATILKAIDESGSEGTLAYDVYRKNPSMSWRNVKSRLKENVGLGLLSIDVRDKTYYTITQDGKTFLDLYEKLGTMLNKPYLVISDLLKAQDKMVAAKPGRRKAPTKSVGTANRAHYRRDNNRCMWDTRAEIISMALEGMGMTQMIRKAGITYTTFKKYANKMIDLGILTQSEEDGILNRANIVRSTERGRKFLQIYEDVKSRIPTNVSGNGSGRCRIDTCADIIHLSSSGNLKYRIIQSASLSSSIATEIFGSLLGAGMIQRDGDILTESGRRHLYRSTEESMSYLNMYMEMKKTFFGVEPSLDALPSKAGEM